MADTNDICVRNIGIPVRSVNWVRLHAGHDRSGSPCIYAIMGQQADNLFVLHIDPETGRFRQYVATVPDANYPTATFMSRAGRLYVGAAYAGHLLCFDPEKEMLDDLGAIHPGAASFPCRIDEDAEGCIWIGSYPSADLTCYNPAIDRFTNYGRMDEKDMYCYPLVNSNGRIACLIRMITPHVVMFDPQTSSKQTVGPVTTKGEETIDLRRGIDGVLYIESSLGNFRIDGYEAVPVDTLPYPPAEPIFPDSSTFAFTDTAQAIYRVIEIRKPNGQVLTHELDYEVSGSDIFYTHAGPDGCLYGSSILPLHLFRYDPKNEELSDLGVCSTSNGEAYSMANFEGKLYISSYPAARISVYDPSQAYHFGEQPGDNPRDLGRIDDISYRPRSTMAGPLGRVWTASLPDYGMWGGPLSWYDPKTDEKGAYYRIFGDGSCYTLAHLEDRRLIAVGTSIAGGSGTQPKVKQAVLFLWDYQKENKIWEGSLDRPVSVFNALLVGTGGRLFGTVHGGNIPPELFVFDPQLQKFTDRIPLPAGHPLDIGLQNGPDGKIYGFTSSCIYRLDTESLTIEEMICEKNAFSVPGPIIGAKIFFGTGHRLRVVTIF